MGAKKKTSKAAKVKSAAKSALSKFTTSKASKGGKRHHKKSALWYAKEIQRIRLKRKYEKVKFKV